MADLPAPGLALAVSDVRGSTLRERLVVRMTTDFPPPPLPCYELRAAGASDIHAVLDLDRAHMKPEVDRLHPGAWDEDGALAIIFLILVAVLIWRPWGLFGTEMRY